MESVLTSSSARLTETRQQEILRAAYELLAEVGYAGLRFDAIATRARASKATLYRHWRSKAQLVAEAVRVCKGAAHEIPDTGTLRGDLLALLGGMAQHIAGEDGPLFCGLIMAMRTDPEFASEMRAIYDSKSMTGEAICTRALARGELCPGYDPSLIEEIGPALLFMHSFGRGEPLDDTFVAHLVDDILLPLLTR